MELSIPLPASINQFVGNIIWVKSWWMKLIVEVVRMVLYHSTCTKVYINTEITLMSATCRQDRISPSTILTFPKPKHQTWLHISIQNHSQLYPVLISGFLVPIKTASSLNTTGPRAEVSPVSGPWVLIFIHGHKVKSEYNVINKSIVDVI